MQIRQDHRHFLASLSMAGAAGILGPRRTLADDGPPETTTIRLPRDPTICVAPQQIADALLRAEGSTDIRYVPPSPVAGVASAEIDFQFHTAPWVVSSLAAGQPITALAGVHVGCYELFAHEQIRTIGDLKGKRIGIPQEPGSSGHMLLTTMVAHVGLDPHTDIDWITTSSGDFMDAFATGEVDAYLGFPPEPQELRARGIGRVILNTATDTPWSHYSCCMTFGHREFIGSHPVATKRYLRAILKAADVCAAEPERAAQQLVDDGYTDRYDYALQTLNEVPYDRWREYDPEDTLRFYALRLHEGRMISKSPNALLAEGTDWRFLNELKRELKV